MYTTRLSCMVLVLQGEPSVFESETGREGMAEPVGRRRAYQMAGIDYDNCDTCQVALSR
jgi:hypothetical protein